MGLGPDATAPTLTPGVLSHVPHGAKIPTSNDLRHSHWLALRRQWTLAASRPFVTEDKRVTANLALEPQHPPLASLTGLATVG